MAPVFGAVLAKYTLIKTDHVTILEVAVIANDASNISI